MKNTFKLLLLASMLFFVPKVFAADACGTVAVCVSEHLSTDLSSCSADTPACVVKSDAVFGVSLVEVVERAEASCNKKKHTQCLACYKTEEKALGADKLDKPLLAGMFIAAKKTLAKEAATKCPAK